MINLTAWGTNMTNIQTLLKTLRKCKERDCDLELTFTPEDARALLSELYDLLAAPVVQEYKQKHGD